MSKPTGWALWSYRLEVLGSRWEALLCRQGGGWHVFGQWPLPSLRPYRRRALRLYSKGGGLGDELMCSLVFQAIVTKNPDCRITYLSRFPDLFRGHPALHAVEPFLPEHRRGAIGLRYDQVLPPMKSLPEMMAECVGLRNVSGGVWMPHLENFSVPSAMDRLPRPIVVVQPRASAWTPNKQWPEERWRELVKRLVATHSVVEVGHESVMEPGWGDSRFLSLCGGTDLGGFLGTIRSSDLFVGPPSGGMHAASLCGVRSVIIFGGYEHPAGYGYPTIEPLYSPVECAPCWKSDDCPFGRKCLWQIEVESVLGKIKGGE